MSNPDHLVPHHGPKVFSGFPQHLSEKRSGHPSHWKQACKATGPVHNSRTQDPLTDPRLRSAPLLRPNLRYATRDSVSCPFVPFHAPSRCASVICLSIPASDRCGGFELHDWEGRELRTLMGDLVRRFWMVSVWGHGCVLFLRFDQDCFSGLCDFQCLI